MKRMQNWNFPTAALLLALAGLWILLVGIRPAAAQEGAVDLSVTLKAPEHVAPGGAYQVNLAYANRGVIVSPQDTWVQVTLPEGVTFTGATDQNGAPLPPDAIDGSVLTWQLGALSLDDCWGHIFINLAVAPELPEDTELLVAAEIASSAVEDITENNFAAVSSLVCDMAGSGKWVDLEEAAPGDVLIYTIRLQMAQRSGHEAETSRMLTLTDTLPFQHQLRFLGWSGPISGEWDGHTLRWQGQVRAGEMLTLQYRVGIDPDIAPGTVITNAARLRWGDNQGEGEMQLGPATTTVTMPHNAQLIGPLGYTWRYGEDITIQVPPGAVSETARFQFRYLYTDTHPAPDLPGWIYAHRAFEMNAFRFGELHQFGQPITVELKLGPQDIPALQRETLRLWYRQGPGEAWRLLGEPRWISEDTLAFTTNHFTEFALFGTGGYWLNLPLIRR